MIEKEAPPHKNLVESSTIVSFITLVVIASALALAILLNGCTAPTMTTAQISKPEKKSQIARITYYTGKHEKVAMGGRAVQGVSVAAHPKYKFKTKIAIPNLYQYLGETELEIQDRGPAVTARKASRGKAEVFDIFVKNYKTMKFLEREAPEYMEVIEL